MMKKHRNYHSFLVRISSSGDSGSWRIYWQNIGTGDRLFFMNLEKFLAFLQIFIIQNINQDENIEMDHVEVPKYDEKLIRP